MKNTILFKLGTTALALGLSAISHGVPLLPGDFDISPFSPVNLNQYCSDTYGGSSYYTDTSSFATDGVCNSGSNQFPVSAQNVEAACDSQFGSNYTAVLLDLRAGNWFCTDWSGVDNKITPVVLIASDRANNLTETDAGIQNVGRVINASRDWYTGAMASGKTFNVVQPVIKISQFTAAQWNEYSCRTAWKADRPAACDPSFAEFTNTRYLLHDQVKSEVSPIFANANNVLSRAVTYIFTDTNADTLTLGAAAEVVGPEFTTGINYNTQPQGFSACNASDANCGVYSLSHEIGHSFGLNHTCEVLTTIGNACYDSIMEAPAITTAILHSEEQSLLDNSVFFNAGFPGGFYAFFEMESQQWITNTTVDNNHSGATGSGFVNTPNQTGAYVTITADVPESGDYTFAIRYANGSTNRQQSVSVNGNLAIGSVDFQNTGGWSNWAEQSFTVNLNSGSNSVTLTSLGGGGAPNYDSFTITGSANTPPIQLTTFSDITITQGNDFVLDLQSAFTDPDGDFVASHGKPSDFNIATTATYGSQLTITAQQIGSTTIFIVATDGEYALTSTFTVTVTGGNQAPVVSNPIAPITLTQGDPSFSIDLNSVFSDPENFGLTFSLETSPSNNVYMESASSLRIDSVDTGTENHTLKATDASGADIQTSLSLTVNATSTGGPFVLQAEDQTWDAGAVESEHAGFTGSAYLNTDNILGTGVDWSVNINTPGTYQITVRYANGSSANRNQAIFLNGSSSVTTNIDLNSTGGWTTWAEQTFNLTLISGTNIIRMESLNAAGAPNLDKITIQ